MNAPLAITVFLLCAIAIAYSGPVLVRSSDTIGWHFHLARSWTGIALLATATSLPELITGLSAVSVAEAPDIAVGSVFGSCMFNLVLIVLLDALHRESRFFAAVTKGHIITAAFGVIAIGIASAGVLTDSRNVLSGLGWIGFTTPVLVLVYILAMRVSFSYDQEYVPAREPVPDYRAMPLGGAVIRYAIAAAAIATAAIVLPVAAVDVSKALGWKQAFTASLFVAAATSLPEFAVSLGALRLRAPDLAIANLLGSNLFNILVLAINDVAYVQGPLLVAVNQVHVLTGVLGMVMSGIVVIALLTEQDGRLRAPFGWPSLALLLVYVLGTLAIYLY